VICKVDLRCLSYEERSRDCQQARIARAPRGARFARWVIRFRSTITIWKGEEKFAAASLSEVLTANLNYGARVVLEASGPDEHEALNKLELLLLAFRDEERGQTCL
jgi:phosphotransferase system HPr (HPr) family protein